MSEYLQRATTIQSRINELAAITDEPGIINRIFGTRAFLEGSKKIAGWMEAAGLQTHTDNIGNVRGRLPSSSPAAQTLVMASHMDTVVNAGRFDGPLGILLGLDIAEQLVQQAVALPF